MKILVLYSSKTGFTANYAKWIAKDLKADLSSLKTFDFSTLPEYDTIIYGGGLYAGGINGISRFKKHLPAMKDKRLLIYFTGASRVKAVNIREIADANFKAEEMANMDFFYLRGGFDFNRLGFMDRCLMGLMRHMLRQKAKKGQLSADDKGMLAAYDQAVDFTKPDEIQPLIRQLRSAQ